MEEEINQQKFSYYNTAVDQIYRFGEIWRNSYRHSAAGNFMAWNLDLDGAWRELASDLKQKYDKNHQRIKQIEDTIAKINQDIVATFPLFMPKVSGFNKTDKASIQKVGRQYQLLQKKEIFLRELQNELGKGTKWADDDIDLM